MNIDFIQTKYDDKIIEKIFPSEMENKSKLISLDSRSFIGDNDEDKMNDYLKRSVLLGGITYNWIITLSGKIYHITPQNKASNSSLFELFSERISREIPEYCPQYKIDSKTLERNPNNVISSICLEEDPNDILSAPSGDQKSALINLLAYLIKTNDLSSSKIINRDIIPKIQYIKDSIGEKAYKNNMLELITTVAYAYLITKKESEINLVEISDIVV